jgi:transposase
MNSTPGGIITVGTRLRFDGGLWEVTELTASAVVLRDALGGLRQASISGLLADPATCLLDTAPAESAPAGPDASGLTPPETEEMRRLAGHVLEVLTGYQRGSEALAQPGEPRPQYAPGTAKLQRCQAKAAELGISVMTVRRMIWRFEADGPEGLIDRRGQRRSDLLAGADARWLDMARQVLAGHTEASKPARDLILAEIAARLDAEHGDGMSARPIRGRLWKTDGHTNRPSGPDPLRYTSVDPRNGGTRPSPATRTREVPG